MEGIKESATRLAWLTSTDWQTRCVLSISHRVCQPVITAI